MKKKLIAITACLCMLVALLPTVALAAEYSDTEGHWAEEDIARWSELGVVNGTAPGVFNPDGVMTRAEAAQVFVNLLKLTGKADLSGYTDVSADAWYADAIAACVDKGILNGTGNGLMDPTGTITREMFFVMFARALGIPEETSLDKSFADSGSISSWARGAVYALINRGYVAGTSDNSVAPQLDINRASVMALLNQTIVAYVVTDGTTVVDGDGVVLVLADDVTLTGSGNVTVSVAAAGATVDLAGMTGEVSVMVLENDVAITNAPAGAEISVAEAVTGATVNGDAVAAGEAVVIPEKQTTTSGSSGGGTTVVPGGDDDDDEEEQEPSTRPTINVGGKDYTWDADKKEYVSEDGDVINPSDITGSIEDMEESVVITVDGKEYFYNKDLGEWFVIGDDEEEYIPTEDVETALGGGANEQDPVV